MSGTASGALTFMFTDIAGSTRLWAEHPTEMDRALSAHDRLIRRVVEEFGGSIFSQAGDSFGASFADPGDAINAAIEIQRALASTPVDDLVLEVRLALHSGTARERDGDFFGPVLNRCSRILGIARGGQILVSAATRGMVVDAAPAGAAFEDLGEHRLRDLAEPERLYLVLHDDLDTRDRRVDSLTSLPNNLPASLSVFVGRAEELEHLRQLIQAGRLVTITGAGGSGKSRLALQVVADLVDAFPDGVWMVELAPVADPEGVARAVASTLGVDESSTRPLLESLIDHLRNRSLLLLLDNCEHLIGSVAALAEALLRSARQLTVVATSREALGVPGETVYSLRSLSLAAAEDWEDVVQSDAGRLFAVRGESAVPGFVVDAASAAPVAQICWRLDGMPLAIELAAARLRMLSVSDIAARLDDRFRLLTGGSRTALPRHQTLEGAISWSFELLDEAERVLFERLSVFVGGFSVDSVEAVCSGDALSEANVIDLLFRLVDKSLVSTVDTGERIRYRLLESVRQFAVAKLAAGADADEVRERHAAYFRGLVGEALPHIRGPDEERWQNRLDAEQDNLRQALRWSIDSGGSESGQWLAGSLYRYWMVRNLTVEGAEWLRDVLAMAPAGAGAHGRALAGAGALAFMHGDFAEARSLLLFALEVLDADAEGDYRAAALGNLATSLVRLGAFEQARATLRDLIVQKESIPQSFASLSLGDVERALGDRNAALVAYSRAVELARASGSPELIANHVGEAALSTVYIDIDVARRYSDELVKQPDMPGSPGHQLVVSGVVARRLGRLDEARQRIEEGMGQFQTLADHEMLASLLRRVFDEWAALCADLGDFEKAATGLAGAEQLLRGSVRLPDEQEFYEEELAIVKDRLGQRSFEKAWERGASMRVDDLIAYLTGEP